MHSEATDPTLATVEAVDVALPIAGIGSRSYAFVVDWHIRFIGAAAWFLGAFLLAALVGSSVRSGGAMFLPAVVPALLIYFLYHPLLEALTQGRTPGKRMAGIRVVARDGGAASTGAHLLRNVFRLLDSLPGVYAIGLVAMIVSRTQSRIGDLACGTLVIFDTVGAPAGLEWLARTSLEPQLALLIDETLQRWPQLDAKTRETLSAQLLARAGLPVPVWAHERRAALQAALNR